MPVKKHGFTIIEVVLVLAIAGLIFLMVFVALPALQRSQRDTQRRNDMSRVTTALTNYQTNQGNSSIKLPANGECTDPDNAFTSSDSACKFIVNYMHASNATTNEFKDPDGTTYSMVIDNSTSKTPSSFDHTIYINVGKKCGDNEGTVEDASNSISFAVLYKLEGAGIACFDNQ